MTGQPRLSVCSAIPQTLQRRTFASARRSRCAIAAPVGGSAVPLALGGGLPIEADGAIVGGIGVSGAPGPDIDADCAQAGIDAIFDEIAF